MYSEKIRELWSKYIEDEIEHSFLSLSFGIFNRHHCETCEYWYLLDEDVLKMISIYFPDIYKHICEGMEGKIHQVYKEEGEVMDSYRTHKFYGFCKRYPPVIGEMDSVLKIGFFSLKNIKLHQLLNGYRFPILPHEERCGEWKLSDWGKERLEEEKKKIK